MIAVLHSVRMGLWYAVILAATSWAGAKDAPRERILRKETVVRASLDEVWHCWTASQGIASFFTPESKIELRLGGPYELYMGMTEPDEYGKRGSEGCKVLSFIPREMLAFEWSFPPKVPTLRASGAKTQVVLRFQDLGDSSVKVKFAQLGWQEGADWDAGYEYFDRAWSNVLKALTGHLSGTSSADRSKANDSQEPSSPTRFLIEGHVNIEVFDAPEKRQAFEIELDAPVSEVWNLLATEAGFRKLGAKEPKIELTPGGAYSFWPGAPNRVLAFVPNEVLSTSGSAPEQFPNVRKGGTWSSYFLEPIAKDRTRLRLVCVGWRPGEKEWDDAFDYFLKANPQFLNHVHQLLSDSKPTTSAASPEGDILRHEEVIDAPVEEVWRAFTTKEGIESWMVPKAEIDLRVGGKMRTHYDPKGRLGDENTIENTILSYEPFRMLSIKATKPPASFPYKEEIKNMWSVIRFEPVDAGRTRVTCTGLGYGSDEASQKLRGHFAKGNAWTLQALKKHFSEKNEKQEREENSAGPSRRPPPSAAFDTYAAQMAAAHAGIRLNELAEARHWLDAASPELRNWEWRHFQSILDASLRRIELGDRNLHALAVSADGRKIAAAGDSGVIDVLDYEAGKPIAQLKGHEGGVYCLDFSPDGRLLASASVDGTARVWDVEDAAQRLIYRGHDKPVPAVAFSPDGTRVASCSYVLHSRESKVELEGQVHIWSATGEGEAVTEKKLGHGGNKPVSCLAWFPDGHRIAAGSWSGHAYVWDSETSDDIPTDFPVPDEGLYTAVNAVAVSPDGKLLAVGAKDRTTRVWNVDTKESVATLRGHDDEVTTVCFSADGARVATGGGDDCIRIWDTKSWSQQSVLRGHEGDVQDLCWTAGDAALVSVGLDGTVRQWEAVASDCDKLRMTHSDACYAAIFSPDGGRLYTCGYDGTIAIWDTADGRQVAHWSAHAGSSTNTLSLSKDGSRLASCSWDGTVRIWNTEDQGETALLKCDEGVYHAAISPDGQRVAATQGKVVWLWNVGAGSVERKLEGHERGVQSVTFSPDGKMLATSGGDKTIRTWNAETGEVLAVFRGHEAGIESVVFSPDGRQLASGSGDGSVRLWEAATGSLIRVLYKGDDAVHRVAFSPDGSRVATGGRRMLFLDVEYGGLAAVLRPNADSIWHLSFSPDGTRIASASTDRSIVILDSRPFRERGDSRTKNARVTLSKERIGG